MICICMGSFHASRCRGLLDVLEEMVMPRDFTEEMVMPPFAGAGGRA